MPVEGWPRPGSPTDLKVGWGTCLVEGSPGSLGPTRKAFKPLYLLSLVGQPLDGPCEDSLLLLYVAVLRFHVLHRHYCARQTRTASISSLVSPRFRLSLFRPWDERGEVNTKDILVGRGQIELAGRTVFCVGKRTHIWMDIAPWCCMGIGWYGVGISGRDKVWNVIVIVRIRRKWAKI